VAVLEVSDTGPGIAPEDLPHVFDRLWRGHEADRVGGSGIGLAVVKGLVEAHGGTVVAESDGRSGTTVRVELPTTAMTA
jgi:two-component system sensor histidine kinase BaeS